ncbi:hypothetical protein EXIGLDRAFT_764333 [Exidia glandulosa HHB12029]|uniref:F-box domain-containing protein n=1 Tax=Exidia glandulosa HHB12029 TaxID=1314781 RepID=A0A165L929_EXIGL|nr:hypothetical protein EXIGLDRAFT_764333 [Exidia glandulosa HHB12029]
MSNATATRPRLPPELTDRILDFAWNDRPTLRACSLVCKAWRSASQFHLFSVLAFEAPGSDIDARLQRLRAHPHLVAHVRILRFVETGVLSWDAFAQMLPQRLPALHPVSAAFVGRHAHHGVMHAFTAPQYASLRFLTLRGATFPSGSQFGEAMSPLGSLRLLELDPLLIASDDMPAAGDPVFQSRCILRVSLVGLHSLSALRQWLVRGGELGNIALSALSATVRDNNVDALHAIAASHQASLQMLRVTVADNSHGE